MLLSQLSSEYIYSAGDGSGVGSGVGSGWGSTSGVGAGVLEVLNSRLLSDDQVLVSEHEPEQTPC